MKKKAINLLLALAMFVTAIAQNFLFAGTKVYANISGMKIGDYVSFGNYDGQPILWRVINLDSQGDPVLFADQILSFKSFDASGNLGNSKWETSYIRKWLNSEESKVTFSNPGPTATAVYKGLNPYNEEAGFLSNFSAGEKEIIKSTTNKVLLTDANKGEKVGGSELHTGVFNGKVSTAVANYDNSFYKNVNDKVFLLSVKELKEYVADRGYEVGAKATDKALLKEQSDLSKGSNTVAVLNYWLRTPTVTKGTEKPSDAVRVVTNSGDVLDGNAYFGIMGVRPALTLQSIQIKSGAGTSSSPYTVEKKNTTPTEEIKLKVVDQDFLPGEGMIDVPVTMSNVGQNGISAFDLWLEYDPQALKYVKVDNSNVQVHIVGNQIRTSFHNVNPISNGTLFTLQFEAVVPEKSSEIKVLEQSGQDYVLGFYDKQESKYPLTYSGAKITVGCFPQIPGDVNGDSTVNSSDALMVIHFALGKVTPTEEQRKLGDLNGDGKINALDALRVMKIVLNIL